MSTVCRGTRRDGEPCTALATGANGYCWGHDPANAEARRQAASKAGKGRGASAPGGGTSPEIESLKRRLSDVVDGVLSGSTDRGRGAVAIQGLAQMRAALELERRWRELGEVEARLAALEQRLERPHAARRVS